MYDMPSFYTNPMSINVQLFQVFPFSISSIRITTFNHYIIRVEDIKLSSSPKYDRNMEDNACKKWIKEICTHIFYYKKCNIFVDKKKINFAPRYFKDMA